MALALDANAHVEAHKIHTRRSIRPTPGKLSIKTLCFITGQTYEPSCRYRHVLTACTANAENENESKSEKAADNELPVG